MLSQAETEERRSDAHAVEIFEPPQTSEHAAILSDTGDVFEQERSGVEVLKQFFKDLFMRTIYFHVSPSGSFYYYWTFLVSIGVLYNMLATVIFIYDDVYFNLFFFWLYTNIFFDFVYILDILFMSRKVFIHDGIPVMNHQRTWKNYLKEPAPFIGTITFGTVEIGGQVILDIVCLLPLDVFLVFNTSRSLLRIGRTLKGYRMLDFMERTQKRTIFPHGLRIFFLMLACFILFHWNACVYFMFSLAEGLSEEDTTAFGFSYYKVFDPRFPTCNPFNASCLMYEDLSTLDLDEERPQRMEALYQFWKDKSFIFEMGNFSREYSMSIYWSALTITTCGQQPWPSNSAQNMLEVIDTLIGVLVFATIIGSVGSVVTQMNQAVYDFREKIDAIKFYMKYRIVNVEIQERVLQCFLYMNSQNQLTDEAEIVEGLPPRLQGQLAVNLHMETLKQVALFKGCEPGFLYEVVLKMKQQIYSPNDYLCRTGEKAKEMFIVKRGALNVIDDDSKVVLESLTDGATFGELSIIHVHGNILGNTRGCSLRAVGYADVYILNQDDVFAVLQDYPLQREILIKNTRECLAAKSLLDERSMADETDDATAVLSMDQQLARLRDQIKALDSQLNNMYTSFNELSTDMKQRVTSLEHTYSEHKDKIKKDIMRRVL